MAKFLKLQDQRKVTTGNCQDEDQWHAGNGQPIREHLLRQAVKSCECYATDILIFFDYTAKEIWPKDIKQIDFYFRNLGIEWVIDGEKNENRIPTLYRDTMTLIIETNHLGWKDFTLYKGHGNC